MHGMMPALRGDPRRVAVMMLVLLAFFAMPAAKLSAQAAMKAPAQAPRQNLGQNAASERPLPENVSGADLMNSARSEVRIIARENHRVEEYRSGNNVYKIKVTPKNAPPYYLVDQDGSGDLQWKRGPDLERDSVPHWALFKW